MTIFGQGVYYFGGCRSIKDDNTHIYKELHELLFNTVDDLNNQFRLGEVYYMIAKNETEKQGVLTKYKTTENELNKRRDYKRVIDTSKPMLVKQNMQYYRDYISLARYLLLFDSIPKNKKINLRVWLEMLSHTHPHQANMDKSDEQQNSTRRRGSSRSVS